MKIFISWSKEDSTSHNVATALYDWLPDVIQGVEPWMSTHDIQSGELWAHAVSKELESNSYGILSITPQSMHAPWLVFEAGALAKFVDKSRVCPYLSGMNATGLTGPLTQLQSRISDKDGTYKLVQDINSYLLEGGLPENRLQKGFERCWPELEDQLADAFKKDSTNSSQSQSQSRNDRELLEEILSLTRKISRDSTKDVLEESTSGRLDKREIDPLGLKLISLQEVIAALEKKQASALANGDNREYAETGNTISQAKEEHRSILNAYIGQGF